MADVFNSKQKLIKKRLYVIKITYSDGYMFFNTKSKIETTQMASGDSMFYRIELLRYGTKKNNRNWILAIILKMQLWEKLFFLSMSFIGGLPVSFGDVIMSGP
jgi:hypothetical protein